MKTHTLILQVIFLLEFGQRATALTEIYRIWQEIDVGSFATGTSIIDGQAVRLTENKRNSFAATIEGACPAGLNSSAPGAGGAVSIIVWGWRTNVSGETYDFDVDFGLVASQSFSTDDYLGQASAFVDHRQYVEFSVLTFTGTETVTVNTTGYVSNPNTGLLAQGPGFALYGIPPTPNPSNGGYIGAPPNQTFSYALPDGDYRLEIRHGYRVDTSGPHQMFIGATASWRHSVHFSNLTPFPGWGFSLPLKNPVSCRYCYDFRQVPKGTWVGAQAATEFSFQMIGSSLFTGIMGFPPGFTNQFEVVVGESSLGFFTTNQSVDFVNLVGQAIPSFKVRNIAPLVEGSVTNTFPIQLNYDTSAADFLMLPNPSLTIFSGTNGQAHVYFAGTMEQSTNLIDWVDVPGSPSSPYLVTAATSSVPLFFRARR